jgi:dihydroorotate dehydrogenase electron transfer subunit
MVEVSGMANMSPMGGINPGVSQNLCEVISNKKIGAYHHITLAAPAIAEHAKPGNFVAINVGDVRSSMLLRRSFAIYQTVPRGPFGGTLEIIVAPHGPGSTWISERQPHEKLDVVGPLGNAFKIPKDPVRALLVGGGYGSAPLFSLAETLRLKNSRVEMAIGASTADRIFAPVEGKRSVHSLMIATEDGSLGSKGRVTDLFDNSLSSIDIVYACGPMAMLKALTEIGAKTGVLVQCAVEESMACGVGLCMTCVLPIRDNDGTIKMLRSCIEGPIFDGVAVQWDGIGTIPPGTYGAHR